MIKKKSYWLKKKKIHTLRILDEEQSAACGGGADLWRSDGGSTWESFRD